MAHQAHCRRCSFTIGDDLVVAGFEQRVDLEHAAIGTYIGIVKVGFEFYAVLKTVPLSPRLKAILRAWKASRPPPGYTHSLKIFQGIVRHVFDVHATFGTVHDHILTGRTVE